MPSPVHSQDDRGSPTETEAELSAQAPTIPLFDFDIPLELDSPYGSRISAFNPAPYESLKHKLSQWFPELSMRDDNHADHLSSSPRATTKDNQSKRKPKSKRPDYIYLEVDFVPQLVSDWHLNLPRTSRGWSGSVTAKLHQALAVVASAPPGYSPSDIPPATKSTSQVLEAAHYEDDNMSDNEQDDPDTLLLGYLIPSAFKDAASHPLTHLDPVLISKEWIQLYGEVTLAPPFLPPMSEVFGPDAFETSSKRVSAQTSKSSSAANQPLARVISRSSDVPSTRLLGTLSVQVGLEPAALQYGAGKDKVDGFVASSDDLKNTAAQGSLGLARALRQAIPSIVDWDFSFVELDTDAHTYWDRNESFYDLPPKQSTLSRHLVLDNVEPLDFPNTSSTSNTLSKKRKKSSHMSFTSGRFRPYPPTLESAEDQDVPSSYVCSCLSCQIMTERNPVVAAPRLKQEALPPGEQISGTDTRLGDITSRKFLPLDTNVTSLLEACRPPSDGPKVYPPSDVIPTPLMGYQARCLAWLIKRETVVDEDIDQLMPNWLPLRCKDARHIMRRRLQLEAEREALMYVIQRSQSRARRTSKVKAAGLAALDAANDAETRITLTSNSSTSATVKTLGPLKREPFIDPVDQTFYFDQISGLLSLRRFCCRPSEPGGALCEAMGLGKTLESLSLIAARPRPDNSNLLEYDTSRSARMISEMEPSARPFVSRATLVVCPAALVEQWMDEIRKHFRSRSTVGTDSLDGHLSQQAGVIRYRHTDFAWDVRSRRADVRALAERKLTQPDIVVATYEELAFQLTESHKVPHNSNQVRTPLLEVLFWRILLDEAQIVAGASGKATSMVHELWRSNCWMVTGTPVTKGIRDIQGIFAFMDHDPLAAPRFFREILQQPFSQGSIEGIRRLRAILPRFVWRHTQVHVEDEITLPPCKNEVLELNLKHVERIFYDKEVSKFCDSFTKQAARGVVNVAQPTFLIHLRQLLSHPQVADEYLYFHNYSRLSFAELFQRFFQQAESELATLRMQLVTTTLQLVWSHDFYTAEKDKKRWRGGPSPLKDSEDVCRELDAALRVVTAALDEQARRSLGSSAENEQEAEIPNAEAQAALSNNSSAVDGTDATGGLEVSVTDDSTAGAEASSSMSAVTTDSVGEAAVVGSDSTLRINLSWEEANYWLRTLLQKHAAPATNGQNAETVIEPPARWDPERPSRTCFDKEFKNADDPSVNLTDPRYHLVVQDAGAEDMGQDEYLALITAQQNAQTYKDRAEPRKKVKMDALEPGLLKKSRLRGKATQRQITRVWSYKPKERLETTRARLHSLQSDLPGKAHEVAFLRQQLLEGLGGETQSGPGQAGDSMATASAEQPSGPECPICFESKIQIAVLPCYHSFCADCIDKICERNPRSASHLRASYDPLRCPKCRLKFLPNQVTRIMEPEKFVSMDGSGTVVGDWSGKISGLIVDLKERLAQDPTHKAVVFSHWPKMLTFAREALVQNGVSAVVFGGNETKQAEALRAMRDDDHVHVILVPFRASAGAAGLSLTSCDLAYLLEPALDTALEAQAVARIHRIGQRRETTIIRVKMKDTIEDAVMRIADERSRRGMAFAAQTNSGGDAVSAAVAASADPQAVLNGAGSSTAAQEATLTSSLNASTSGQEDLVAQARVQAEEQKTLQAGLLTSNVRERSIKASLAASVGVGRESDNISLTMAEVGLILGFDAEEVKRKAKERRESVLRRAEFYGLYDYSSNARQLELDNLELEVRMEEGRRAMESWSSEDAEEVRWALEDEEENERTWAMDRQEE